MILNHKKVFPASVLEEKQSIQPWFEVTMKTSTCNIILLVMQQLKHCDEITGLHEGSC